MRLLRAVLLACLALSLIAAGCGGDTKENNDYVDAVNKAQNEFVASVSKVQQAGSAAQAQDVFNQLNTAIDKVVADLKAVDPPSDVKDLHNKLIAEMSQFDKAISDASAAVQGGDPQKIQQAQTTLATDVAKIGTDVSKTISDINQKLQG